MTNLLLQVLFVIFPLILYHAWFRSMISKETGRKTAFTVVCAVSAVICMTNPIQIFPDLMFYITTVPWVIAFAYGGMMVGLFVSLAMGLCLGLSMVTDLSYPLPIPIYFIAYGFTLVIIGLFHLRRWLITYRFASIMILTILNTSSLLLAHWLIHPSFTHDLLPLYLCYISLNLCCAWLSAYMIEFFIERDRLMAEVQRSEKMKVVGQLAASVAHEVRNPMTVVRGFLQLMHDSPETSSRHRSYILMMLTEMDRAQDIISEYLTLARPTADHVSLVNVYKILASVKDSIIPYAIMRNVHIIDREQPGEYWVHGNEEKIKQVFLNLIKNAIEANPAGGTVETNIERIKGHLAIVIKDNGVGMSKEQLETLGMPFYSTKEHGTGLGLMVCYNIIHALGGKILADSERGMGTQFTVLLPESKPETVEDAAG